MSLRDRKTYEVTLPRTLIFHAVGLLNFLKLEILASCYIWVTSGSIIIAAVQWGRGLSVVFKFIKIYRVLK